MQVFKISSPSTLHIAFLVAEKDVHYLSCQRWLLFFGSEYVEFTSSYSLNARIYARRLFRERFFPYVSMPDVLENEIDILCLD